MILAKATQAELRAAVEAVASEYRAGGAPRINSGFELLKALPVREILAETEPVWSAMSGADGRVVDVLSGAQWGLSLGATIQAAREMQSAFGDRAPAARPCASCEGRGSATRLWLFRSRCVACGGKGVIDAGR